MMYYDVSNNIPVSMTYNGPENKNSEISCLIDYLKEKHKNGENLSNILIIADRGYFKYYLKC